MSQDKIKFDLLCILDNNPNATQREISRQLGVSLGKVNYCLNKLIDKGLIKANNFRKSSNKRKYYYLLTPKGIEEKINLTFSFLKIKSREFEAIKKEISKLQEK